VRPHRIPGLPDCPQCNETVEELVHIAPAVASAKPSGCVFAPGEFFPDAVLEADHLRELVTDGGVATVDRPPLGPCDICERIRRCSPIVDGRYACADCYPSGGGR
jgi:hypothetical protein